MCNGYFAFRQILVTEAWPTINAVCMGSSGNNYYYMKKVNKLIPYTYKFSRHVIFVVEKFSGISWFYFRGLLSIQKYSSVLFSRIFSNVWSRFRSRISALQKISFTVCTDLANNSSPSGAVNMQCLIARSNEIIEGRGTVPFACFISFCLGWRFKRKMGVAPGRTQVVFN